MIAAVYHAPGDVRVEDMPEPGDPSGADVILEVTRAAICGTDASEFMHAPKFFPIAAPHPFSGHQGPTIMGHEFTGRVVACGPEGAGSASATASCAGPACPAASASGACGAGRTCARATTRSVCTATAGSRRTCARRHRSAASCPRRARTMRPRWRSRSPWRCTRCDGAAPRRAQSLAVIGAGGIGSFLIGAAAASGFRE